MNKIAAPAVDDHTTLKNLADNKNVGSYPHIRQALDVILSGYVQYQAVGGDPFAVDPVVIQPDVCAFLKGHYKSPPKELRHIDQLRDETSHACCSMCGSMHSGTLDHLLPQDSYGAFAVFSLNLVPACSKCNSKRQATVVGPQPGQRVLHPYFDECLSERLVVALFEELAAVPKVSLRLHAALGHSQYPAIEFHVENIVARTSVLNHLRTCWINLCRKPSLAVRSLKKNPESQADLRNQLEEELGLLDEAHGGKNNWNSMFVAGLLDEHVLAWLFDRFHADGRLPDGRLI